MKDDQDKLIEWKRSRKRTVYRAEAAVEEGGLKILTEGTERVKDDTEKRMQREEKKRSIV